MGLCNLPLEKKLGIEMVKSKHFAGYLRLGCENTAQQRPSENVRHKSVAF